MKEGHKVAENRERQEAIKGIADADEETVKRVRALLEADRAMLEKKKKGKPDDNNSVPPRAANED